MGGKRYEPDFFEAFPKAQLTASKSRDPLCWPAKRCAVKDESQISMRFLQNPLARLPKVAALAGVVLPGRRFQSVL
jgi:hypothetical protein